MRFVVGLICSARCQGSREFMGFTGWWGFLNGVWMSNFEKQ